MRLGFYATRLLCDSASRRRFPFRRDAASPRSPRQAFPIGSSRFQTSLRTPQASYKSKGEQGASMPHYGILREYKLEEVDDVRGADVYGVNDEKLGTIDDVVFDHANGEIRYIVLKTGGVLSSKRIMVPANRIEPYGNHDNKFYAELDKTRLEMLPEFNDDMLKSE